jgi:hypothetical protein|tara:strand:+ start:28 stop:288 length:261 start_codon:yes stop_codon:yes gene_type:complete
MKLTSKDVRKYMLWRTDEELVHCPDCIAAACNDMAEEFSHNAKDLMKLLFFNDPIPSLHTHNYGFHTATGRHIIETLKDKYYEYKE